MNRFGDWRWHLDIFVLRYGWWPLVGATVLLLSLLVWQVWLPIQEARVRAELQELLAQPENIVEGTPVQAVNTLNLPLESMASESVQSVLLLAKKYGLTIAQADYKRHESGRIGRWQLQLPVTASYPQIRRFMRAAKDIQGLSVDELGLRGSEAGVEARLSFSIWFEVKKPVENLDVAPVEGGR